MQPKLAAVKRTDGPGRLDGAPAGVMLIVQNRPAWRHSADGKPSKHAPWSKGQDSQCGFICVAECVVLCSTVSNFLSV